MAVSDYMFDIASTMGVSSSGSVTPKHTTNKKAGQSLDMDDFLTLMVAMLQNQTMDNTADTSEMMNQMVQMSVVQAITNISTLVSDSTSLTYAASLVGKEVTIGQYDAFGKLQEMVGEVTGTGTLNGQQVVFIGDKCFNLTDIMAIGRLPDAVKGAEETESQEESAGETQAAAVETADAQTTGDETSGTEELPEVVIERTVDDIPDAAKDPDQVTQSGTQAEEAPETRADTVIERTVEDIPDAAKDPDPLLSDMTSETENGANSSDGSDEGTVENVSGDAG